MVALTEVGLLSGEHWETIKSATSNVTSLLTPSGKDLLMVVPRMAVKAGSFVTAGIPEAFENMFGGGITGRAIAEATAERVAELASAVATEASFTVPDAIPLETVATNGSAMQALSFQLKTFGGIFSYVTSKWALGCFAAAVILNRTTIYAAPRRHVTLDWQLRAALRIIPIILLFQLALSIFRRLRCQTSPSYFDLRYSHLEESKRPLTLDFAGEGGLFYHLSSTLIFWESDASSCLAVNMIPNTDDTLQVKGSLSLLWPAFLTFCLSQFTETLTTVIEGRPPATESGMSLFEHSLAFAEAEAMVGTQLAFASTKAGSALNKVLSQQDDGGTSLLVPLKGWLLMRCNTTPEVLIMTLISCLNNLSSHILGVLGLQARYRLINTGFWAICFMSSFIWCFSSFSVEDSLETGIFRFPTVCVVGFLPHLIIIVGIITCSCIYCIGVLLTALSTRRVAGNRVGFIERLRYANRNMQAHVQMTGITLRMSEDFYTALLKIGFTALTAASEAVFLNEGRRVNVGHWTWLEEEKMNEILQARGQGLTIKDESRADGRSLFSASHESGSLLSNPPWKSGYSVERNTKILKKKPTSTSTSDSVGAMQRGGRYMLALNFQTKIFRLLAGWAMLAILRTLSALGITWRPAWIRRMLADTKIVAGSKRNTGLSQKKELDFWLINEDGEIMLPKDSNIDVANEMRKRIEISGKSGDVDSELDNQTYSWFKHGGWWGDIDTSSDYSPPQADEDDDTTSILSSTTDLDSAWETDSGRRTPTASDPYPERNTDLETAQLARLLNPQSAEDRIEAKLLGARLARDGPLTRSQYSRLNSSILTSTNYRPKGFTPSATSGQLTSEEESEVLESLILRFRENKRRKTADSSVSTAWEEGAEGLGAGGPMCVVCQSTPRTILAWPCRCLSLCEDCRVSLAMNNFGTCVCCRQEVVGFSRLFVP